MIKIGQKCNFVENEAPETEDLHLNVPSMLGARGSDEWKNLGVDEFPQKMVVLTDLSKILPI